MKAMSRRTRLFLALAVLGCVFAGYGVTNAYAQCGGSWYHAPICGPPVYIAPPWCEPGYPYPYYIVPGFGPVYYGPLANPYPSAQGQKTGPGGNQAVAPQGNQPAAPSGNQAAPQGGSQQAVPNQGALGIPAPTGNQASAAGQKICPVTGLTLGSMGPPYMVRVKVRDVFLCCKDCEAKILSDPNKYLAKLSF